MKLHPILFSGDMVRAILEGRKTQTRRPVRAGDPFGGIRYAGPCAADAEPCSPMRRCDQGENHVHYADGFHWKNMKCPYGVPGDELWVREAFRLRADQDAEPPSQDRWKDSAWYEADQGGHSPTGCAGGPGKLRPSIHMPRWASRITLKVTDVRVQRLMDASEADIIAEGFTNSAGYQSAMMKAYGDGITYVNPWVWAITFEVRP